MKKISLIGLLLLFSSVSFAQNESESLFLEANKSYAQGNYEEAAEQYNKILQQGKQSPQLYYNLGNSYFKLKKKGKALLNYKRALKEMPGDEELKFNIRLVESQLKDQIAPIQKNPIVRNYWEFVGSLSLTQWSKLFLLIYLLLLLFLLLALVFQKGRKYLLRASLGIGMVWMGVALFFGGGVWLRTLEKGVVLAESVQARFGPSEKDVAAFDLHEGATFKIMDYQGKWVQIELTDGKIAWLPEDSFEKI